MPIDTKCPYCDTSYCLADHLGGKNVRCKQCNAQFTVGGAARAAVTNQPRSGSRPAMRPARGSDDDRARADREWDDRPVRRPRRSGGGLPGWAIALLIILPVLLVLLVGGTVWAILANSKVDDTPLFAPQARETDFNKIRIGMTEEEVLRMYGEPMTKENLDKIWFWHNGLTEKELMKPDGSLRPVRMYRYALFGKGFETVIFVEGRVYKRNGNPNNIRPN
jgi:hypothetical protein